MTVAGKPEVTLAEGRKQPCLDVIGNLPFCLWLQSNEISKKKKSTGSSESAVKNLKSRIFYFSLR